jgi:hypothetical protein
MVNRGVITCDQDVASHDLMRPVSPMCHRPNHRAIARFSSDIPVGDLKYLDDRATAASVGAAFNENLTMGETANHDSQAPAGNAHVQ